MKKNITILLILLFSVGLSFSQIPIEEYRTEVENLKSANELEASRSFGQYNRFKNRR